MVKRVIYIHGFNSSEKSYKAVRFGELMANYDVDYCVPRLNHEPLQAILQLEHLLTPDTALLQRYNLRAALINPAVAPFNLLAPLIGHNYNPYQDYHYELNTSHMDALKALYVPKLTSPELLYLLQQTGDEVLNYQHAVNYFSQCKQLVEFGGDHSFVGFERTLDSIVEFLKLPKTN